MSGPFDVDGGREVVRIERWERQTKVPDTFGFSLNQMFASAEIRLRAANSAISAQQAFTVGGNVGQLNAAISAHTVRITGTVLYYNLFSTTLMQSLHVDGRITQIEGLLLTVPEIIFNGDVDSFMMNNSVLEVEDPNRPGTTVRLLGTRSVMTVTRQMLVMGRLANFSGSDVQIERLSVPAANKGIGDFRVGRFFIGSIIVGNANIDSIAVNATMRINDAVNADEFLVDCGGRLVSLTAGNLGIGGDFGKRGVIRAASIGTVQAVSAVDLDEIDRRYGLREIALRRIETTAGSIDLVQTIHLNNVNPDNVRVTVEGEIFADIIVRAGDLERLSTKYLTSDLIRTQSAANGSHGNMMSVFAERMGKEGRGASTIFWADAAIFNMTIVANLGNETLAVSQQIIAQRVFDLTAGISNKLTVTITNFTGPTTNQLNVQLPLNQRWLYSRTQRLISITNTRVPRANDVIVTSDEGLGDVYANRVVITFDGPGSSPIIGAMPDLTPTIANEQWRVVVIERSAP